MAPKKRSTSKPRRRVAVVTGTRAEFGLLVPVMDAIKKNKGLDLLVVAAGAHFLKPARTIREVEAKYPIAARVPMQKQGRSGRSADAEALGRGVAGFAKTFAKLKPDWVVVLGDRIEAFAAASAASIAGTAVCHIHGGDRAEGIADEAMRHAITKLSHLHCAATKLSADRIRKMGEKPEHVHVTGSPAIDGLSRIKSMSDAEANELHNPRVVVLMHPCGLGSQREDMFAFIAGSTARHLVSTRHTDPTVLWLAPNSDPGREQIESQRLDWGQVSWVTLREHLPRQQLVALFKRLARKQGGCVVGNSSAGLIECAAIGLPAINLGPRQTGRERAVNALSILSRSDSLDSAKQLLRVSPALFRAATHVRSREAHQRSPIFGDGRAGPRIAALLARTNPHTPELLRKHNSY